MDLWLYNQRPCVSASVSGNCEAVPLAEHFICLLVANFNKINILLQMAQQQ